MKHARTTTRLVAIGAAALATLALAACGGSDDSGSSDVDLSEFEPSAEVERGVSQETFGDVEAEGDYSLAATLPWLGDPFWVGVAYGIESRAEELGVDMNLLAANGYGDTTNQLNHFDTFDTQGVDGVVVGAVDNQAVAPRINQLWESGTPIAYATVLADSDRKMGVYTDDALAGEAQAEYIAAQDPDAKVVMFCGPPGVIWPKLRCDAFKETLAEKAPNAEVVTEKYHQMDRAVVAEIMGNTLQAFPDATWVYNNTDLQAKGVVDALRAEGKEPGEVKVTNLTMSEELVDIFQDGWIEFAVAERPVLQGRLAVDQLVRSLNGETDFPGTWQIEMPGFSDIEEFDQAEADLNYAPGDFDPS